IRIDGQFYANPYTEGDKIGYLPQSDFLPNDDTVTSVVKRFLPSEPSRNLVSSNERIRTLLKKKISALSGGEKRYFQVLLILNLPTAFVLLDEPFSQVEPLYRAEIKALINVHKQEKGILLTDHDYVNLM